MDEDLCIPVDALVKVVVGYLGVLNTDLVRNDKAGLGPASNDEVSEVAVVRLDIALASAERQALDAE